MSHTTNTQVSPGAGANANRADSQRGARSTASTNPQADAGAQPIAEAGSGAGTRTAAAAQSALGSYQQAAQQLVQQLLAEHNISAAAFIVTLYGDVVEPRGGVLWMGSIIHACAAVDISENQVRTAVSRLVRAGQFQGERIGRRSFYRLTEAARDEFNYAAEVIYALKDTQRWQLVYVGADEALLRRLKRLGYVQLTPRLAMGPDHIPLPNEVVVWQIDLLQGQEQFADFVAEYWDLTQYEQAYQQFIAQFQAVPQWVPALPAQLALTLRLLMVHQYRQVVLRTPYLPVSTVPEQQLELQARQLFARCYLQLSVLADQYIGQAFENTDGNMPQQTDSSKRRLHCLQNQDI